MCTCFKHVHDTNTHGPLTRYVTLRVAHAPGMPGSFSRHRLVSSPGMHHGTCVTHAVMHVRIANPRWQGKRLRHSRRMRNPQYYVYGKRSMYVCIMNMLKTCAHLLSMFAHGWQTYTLNRHIHVSPGSKLLYFRINILDKNQHTW